VSGGKRLSLISVKNLDEEDHQRDAALTKLRVVSFDNLSVDVCSSTASLTLIQVGLPGN